MLTFFGLLIFKAPVSREHSQTTRVEPQLCTDWCQTSLSCWIGITLQSQFFICYPSTPAVYSDNPSQVFRTTAELHCHNDGEGQSTEEQQNLFSWIQVGCVMMNGTLIKLKCNWRKLNEFSNWFWEHRWDGAVQLPGETGSPPPCTAAAPSTPWPLAGRCSVSSPQWWSKQPAPAALVPTKFPPWFFYLNLPCCTLSWCFFLSLPTTRSTSVYIRIFCLLGDYYIPSSPLFPGLNKPTSSSFSSQLMFPAPLRRQNLPTNTFFLRAEQSQVNAFFSYRLLSS